MIVMKEETKKKYARWLTGWFVKLQAANGERMTVGEFADIIQQKRSMTSHYMNGKYIPSYMPALKISEQLKDYEGMRILGFPVPNDHDALPGDFRRRLEAAEEEVNRTLEARGLTGEMPEAETVTIEIFEKWGFRYTSTSKPDEASTK